MVTNILARCIGCFNCLYLLIFFVVVLWRFLDGDISKQNFIVWEPILFLNILSNFYLILRVRKSVLIVWFAFTSIYLKCTLFLLGLNLVTIIVNAYIIITIFWIAKEYKDLNDSGKPPINETYPLAAAELLAPPPQQVATNLGNGTEPIYQLSPSVIYQSSDSVHSTPTPSVRQHLRNSTPTYANIVSTRDKTNDQNTQRMAMESMEVDEITIEKENTTAK